MKHKLPKEKIDKREYYYNLELPIVKDGYDVSPNYLEQILHGTSKITNKLDRIITEIKIPNHMFLWVCNSLGSRIALNALTFDIRYFDSRTDQFRSAIIFPDSTLDDHMVGVYNYGELLGYVDLNP